MNTKVTILLTIAFVMLGSSWARADLIPNTKDQMSDRTRYQRLIRDIRSIDAEYSKVMQRAVVETNKNGEASLETKSQLLSLADRRDRIINRITLLALRHGWDVPSSDKPEATASEIPDERQRVFEPAEQMIKDKFAKDARQIVSNIALPVIPIEAVKQDSKSGKAKKWFIF